MFKHNRFKSRSTYHGVTFLLLYLTWVRNVRALPSPFKSMHQKSLVGGGGEIIAHRRVVADTSKVTNLTRQHNGDIFFSYDVHKCDTDTCVGLSSGTASLYIESNVKEMDMSIKPTEYECKCQCMPHLHTYREDQGICVDEIRECSMATFTSGSSTEKIPFIFLPLKGQIIYPSKEIFYPGIKESVCEVIGSQYLTKNGWNELRNPSDTSVPFRLFRDEDSTFLQWLGEPDLRYRMQGRLIVVHMACRDMDSFDMTGPEDDIAVAASTTVERTHDRSTVDHGNTFTPCVAFRIVGTPTKYSMNVAEVLFASESQIDDYHFMNLTTKEYIVIGISSLCLGLIYIASVFLYLHIKKRKARASDGSQNAKDDYTYHQNDQVTFGAGISCGMFGGQSRSSLLNLSSTMNGSQRRTNNSVVGGGGNGMNLHHVEEMGVIKSNPLLKHYPNLAASDNSGFVSDNSNSNSEFDDDFSIEQDSNKQTSAIVHLGRKRGDINVLQQQNGGQKRVTVQDSLISSTQETECLPEEDVSITEDISHDDQIENMKALINGNSRRKLYFNPAYFEPHLLASPPPAAIEFLNKIREVISIAKYKMAAKRFQPSLTEIPEEKAHKEIYQTVRQPPSRRESFTQHKSICSGCSDCQSKSTDHYAATTTTTTPSCTNCGDKQKSIQKWLESVSSNHDSAQNEMSHELCDTYITTGGTDNSIKKGKNDICDKTTYDIIKPEIKPKPVNANTNSISSKKSESSISNSDADTVKRVKTSGKLGNRTIRTPTNSSPPTNGTQNEDNLPKIVSYCPKPNVIIPDEGESDQYGLRVTTKLEAHTNAPSNKNSLYSSVDKGDYFSNNPSSRASSVRGSVKKVPTREDVIYAFATNKTKRGGSLTGSEKNQQSLYSSIDGGSEIYNNPVFDTTDISSATLEKPSVQAKRSLYEKYNSAKRNSIPYDVINKMNQMPDMIYEAMASDYSRNINSVINNRISSPQLPTPDYTSHDEDTSNATLKRIHQRLQRSMTQSSNDSHPPVPTPDYNTLGRRTPKKLYAPDSPTYSRKSPYSLIVDYETDSLERGARDKARKSATPPSQSSETSQASPSLSSALPLEEELEIRNATYNRVEGFRKEADGKNIMLKRQDTGPKIKYNTPFLGSMTIEVEHSPDEFDLSTDSDQFEPDTLDRKSRKNKGFFKGEKSATYFGTSDDTSQLMQSLPDMRSSIRSVDNTKKVLENLGTKPGVRNGIACNEHKLHPQPEIHKSVENIKSIYEEKSKPKNADPFKRDPKHKHEGKILTLEHRHSKRQRQITAMNTLDKKLAPPDLIPCEKASSKLSENKIQSFVKALNTPSHTSWAHKHDKSKTKCKYQTQVNSVEDTNDSNSVTSGSTNFTGVSDTQGNSEFESKGGLSTKNSTMNPRGGHKKCSSRKFEDRTGVSRCKTPDEKPMTLLEDYLSLGISNENFIDHVNKKLNAYKNESISGRKGSMNDSISQDLDKIEVVSTKTLSNNGSLKQNDENNRKSPKRSGYKDFDKAINNLPTTTKVFRAEINPSTNGMQIAMGLRDKANKSKEIKSALWRFISIATSKLKGDKFDTDRLNKTIVDQIIDKDDGIGSLLDESAVISISKPFSNSLEKIKPSASSNVSRSNSSRMSSRETDGGYMSADSNELKTRENKRLYERFNFTNKVNCISEEICPKMDSIESDEYEKPLTRPKFQAKDISEPIHTSPNTTNKNSVRKTNTVGKQSIYMLSPPSRPPPPPPVGVVCPSANTTHINITQINGKQMIQQLKDVINVNVQYLSEEEEGCGVERYSNGGECASSGESEEEFGLDDICESGAESVETHSVFFKNIKNFYNNDK